ncbi:hypothetical protein AB0I81_16595 [Nonomuraea sp. NPDC050404]|uniref:hypothetical protein n=1 Tax=Nonomuraea sp. NPDC050404 TaxID=3155783 RepID=UPI0033D8EF00
MMSVGLARKAAAFGAGAAVLAVLSAGLVTSPAQAATSTTAKAAKVSVAKPKVSKGDYEGSCPVKINFSAKIKVPVKGKTELAYRWLHGDGSKSKVKVVKLKGKGTKTVTVKQSVTFKEDVKKGWEAVQVLGPKKATSKKSYFSVDCQKEESLNEVVTHGDDSIDARAWASPSSYVGRCDTPGDKIDFTGVIKTDRPRWVRYRWVLNGDVVDYGKVKVYDARKVGFGINPRHSERGWAKLEVLGRDGTSSNRAYYKVWCKKDKPEYPDHHDHDVKVSAAASVKTGTDCTVSASGQITSTGEGRVSYTWSLNGTEVSSGTTYFDRKGGTHVINGFSQTVSGEATKGGVVRFSISGEDDRDSVSTRYAACKTPPTTLPAPAEKAEEKPAATPSPSATATETKSAV